MKVRLNNREHYIKPASLLTVKEYLKLSEKASYSLIDYLAVVTGKRFETIAKIKISSIVLRKLYAYIGGVEPFNDFLQTSNIKLNYHFNGKAYCYKHLDCETLGVRMLMEQRTTDVDNVIELSVYLLAVLIDGSYDSDKVGETYRQLLECNYVDTFGYSCFFFKKFNRGLKKESKSLRKRLKALIISTVLKSRRSREGG